MVIAIVLCSILLIFPWSSDGYLLPKMVAVSAMLIPMSFMKREPGRPMLLIPGLIFLGAVLVCGLFGRDPLQSLFGPHHAQFYSLVPLAIVFLVYTEATKCRDSRSVDMAIGIAGAIAGLIAILEVFHLDPLAPIGMETRLFNETRAASTIGNPVMLGFVLALCLLRCVSCAVDTAKQGVKPRYKVFGLSPYLCVQMGLICAGLVATQSRGALLAVGVGLVVMFRGSKWALLAIAITILTVGGLVYSRGLSTIKTVDSGRLIAWRIAAETFVDHPVLGSGPSTFLQEYVQRRTKEDVEGLPYSSGHECAHNLVLQVASTMGLVGLASMAIFCAALWAMVYWHEMDDLLPVLAGFATCSLVGPIPWSASVLMAILVGVSEDKCKSQK